MKLLITIALLTVVLLAVIHLSYSSVKEADVDAFGDSVQDIDVEAYLDEYIEKIDGKSTNVEEVLNENTNLDGQIIRIRNNYNNAITLYWDGTQFNQGVHLMATLAPHDVAAFDTTVGHKFYALSVGEESRVTPYQVLHCR